MSERLWCEVPTVKGGGCTRHTNYRVTDVSVERWKAAFPHDNAIGVDVRWFGAYVCGNHLHQLRKAGLRKHFITHLDGPDGLIRR